MNQPLVLKESQSFSKGSYKLIGVLIVVFILGLIPLVIAGYKPMAIFSALGIIILQVRKRITILDFQSKEIKHHISLLAIPVPFTEEKVKIDSIDKISVKFNLENSSIVASRSNVPTRFDIKEYYVELNFVGSKNPVRIKVFQSYEKALSLGEKIAQEWNIKLVDFIKIRDLKAKKKKIERQKRGLR